MTISYRTEKESFLALIEAEGNIFKTGQDMLDVMAECAWNGAEIMIIQESHLMSEFFDLKTGQAGEMLQKFSNFRMKLCIIGDFSKYESSSLRDFMRESNRSGTIFFVSNFEELLHKLS